MKFTKTKICLPILIYSLLSAEQSLADQKEKLDLTIRNPITTSERYHFLDPINFSNSTYDLSFSRNWTLENEVVSPFERDFNLDNQNGNFTPNILYHNCNTICVEISLRRTPLRIYYRF